LKFVGDTLHFQLSLCPVSKLEAYILTGKDKLLGWKKFKLGLIP